MQVLNEAHSEGLRQALSRPKSIVDDAVFISIDRQGADVRVRRSNEYVVERMTFSTVRGWYFAKDKVASISHVYTCTLCCNYMTDQVSAACFPLGALTCLCLHVLCCVLTEVVEKCCSAHPTVINFTLTPSRVQARLGWAHS